MITLNLISPEKKQQFKLEQIYIVIKNLIIFVLLVSIIVATVLLATQVTLQNHFQRIVNETTLTTQYANTFSAEVREFNKIITAISEIQGGHTDWTSFIVNFSAMTPKEVDIKNMTINGDKILLKGFASSRDDLLELKNNFETSEMFTEIEMPIDDLLKKNNINFDIKATIIFEKI